MAHSMTAFGRVEESTAWGSLIWEIRSVNHRYLDIAMRLPEDLRSVEAQVRQLVGARIGRGKVDCTLRFQSAKAAPIEIEVNRAVFEQLLQASRTIRESEASITPLRIIDILSWPGVLRTAEIDVEVLGKTAMNLLDKVLDDLVQTRAREGEQMAKFITQRLDTMDNIAVKVRELLPEIATTFRERLDARLAEIKQQLDPGRLEQEVVLFAQKTDVDEELDRLITHLTEIRNVLTRSGQIGRRLDFLLQELNREANTLGSKSVDTRLINAGVELKVLIEQIREQVQNIE